VDLMNSLRQAADNSRARTLLLNPKVRSGAATIASVRFLRGLSVIENPTRFLRRVLSPQVDDVDLVRLRTCDVTLALPTHRSSLELLYEVFIERCYEPPVPLTPRGDLPHLQVLDVGANCGVFAGYALCTWPSAHVTCVEPDPENLDTLRLFREANPQYSITIIEAAVTTFNGEVNFESGLGAGSLISDKGSPTTAVDFFDLASDMDFIKIDIERGEWPILEDPRLGQLNAAHLVMEYHRRYAGDTEARETAESLLGDAAFTIDEVVPNHWGHGTLKAHR
jgi:FkbM family methyltransferase